MKRYCSLRLQSKLLKALLSRGLFFSPFHALLSSYFISSVYANSLVGVIFSRAVRKNKKTLSWNVFCWIYIEVEEALVADMYTGANNQCRLIGTFFNGNRSRSATGYLLWSLWTQIIRLTDWVWQEYVLGQVSSKEAVCVCLTNFRSAGYIPNPTFGGRRSPGILRHVKGIDDCVYCILDYVCEHSYAQALLWLWSSCCWYSDSCRRYLLPFWRRAYGPVQSRGGALLHHKRGTARALQKSLASVVNTIYQ